MRERTSIRLPLVGAAVVAVALAGCAATAPRPVARWNGAERPAARRAAERAARPEMIAQSASVAKTGVIQAGFEREGAASGAGPPAEGSTPSQSSTAPPAGVEAAASDVAITPPADRPADASPQPLPADSLSPYAPRPHTIDLPTVLMLVNGQNPQVLYARERIQEAFAQLERAQVLWLPSIRAGITYDKHEGPAQQIDGNMINTSRTALFTGFGGVLPGAATPAIPGLYANFEIVDAIFQPRIAQRTAASRESAASAVTNDTLLDAALNYLELLRAEQDLAIAREARDHTQRLADLTGDFAQTGQGTNADYDRALAELAVRANDVERGEEAIRVSAARLARRLSLDPLLGFVPREPIVVPIELVAAETPAAELVARGLVCRPEVAESRHLIGEAVERLRREQYAPLIPSVLLGIGYGGFGGAEGRNVSDFSASFDSVVGALWNVRNLGFGERAARHEARSRVQQAQWNEVAALDRVASEVVEAHVQVVARRRQFAVAEDGVRTAQSSYERNLERIRHVQGLPIEVLQSIQALAQARREYLRVVISYNEAQFRLLRALGWPEESAEPELADGGAGG
ncbi:MAG: TolC family protein [Planctomycetaceae bacterium]